MPQPTTAIMNATLPMMTGVGVPSKALRPRKEPPPPTPEPKKPELNIFDQIGAVLNMPKAIGSMMGAGGRVGPAESPYDKENEYRKEMYKWRVKEEERKKQEKDYYNESYISRKRIIVETVNRIIDECK